MKNILLHAEKAMNRYKDVNPSLSYDGDYYPLKITEEWGECLKEYLSLTGKGRIKGRTEAEIRKAFENEFADVFGFLLMFAIEQNIDLEEVLKKKWS